MNVVDIKGIRRTLKLSQLELADILNVSQPYISDLEQGRRNVTEDLAVKLNSLLEGKEIQESILVSEPGAIYGKRRNSHCDVFDNSDFSYKVTELNETDRFKRGQVLACKLIHHQNFLIYNIPYLIITKSDKLHLIRYITGHDDINNTYNISNSLLEKGQSIHLNEVDKIYIIEAEMNILIN